MNNFLEIRNLYFGYKQDFFVLKDINLSISEGEFLGIIGPNGVGKTTLLKTIARVLMPCQGKIILENKNIFDYYFIDYAKKVSFATVITDYAKKFKVEEFLSLARYPFLKVEDKNLREEVVNQIAEEFELKKFFNKHLYELSLGELQRVIIAQSFIQIQNYTLQPESKLLLLDEPTSHLDISHQVKILDLIKKFSVKNKVAVISVFHDLNLASEYCDKIVLLNKGEVAKLGSCNEVINYKILEEVYDTKVIVVDNPISKKPYVFPVPFMWNK